MVVQRISTAAVGIPILYLLIKKGPPWGFFALASVCAGLAAKEACALLRGPGRSPLDGLAIAGAVATGLPFLLAGSPAWTGFLPPSASALLLPLILILVLAAILLAAVRARDTLREVVEASMGTVFAILFVGLPLGFLTGLRAMDDEEMGRDLLLLLLVTIWIGDTFAMVAGSWLGRHRLAPRISPGKSVEGAVAGVAGSVGASLLAHVWWFQRLEAAHAVAIGLLLGIVGILGDLAESVLKRAAGTKDSSAILPGHGGMLDRVDSLLFAGPALYYYYLAVLR